MKELICITCPRGCHLKVDEENMTVTGNSCNRGKEYGLNEVIIKNVLGTDVDIISTREL